MKLHPCASTTATIFAMAVAAATNHLGVPTLALKENCIEQADLPPTIYEAAEMSPQNMDFDMKNNVSNHLYMCIHVYCLIYNGFVSLHEIWSGIGT